MFYFALIVLACGIAAVVFFLLGIHQRHAGQRKRVSRVRRTDLYGHVYPMLLRYKDKLIERVIIRPDGVTIRTVVPIGEEVSYTFSRHGIDHPSDDTLYALAQAVAVDIRPLRDPKHYTFAKHHDHGRNGQPYVWYDYMIRSSYKDFILRSEIKKHSVRTL